MSTNQSKCISQYSKCINKNEKKDEIVLTKNSNLASDGNLKKNNKVCQTVIYDTTGESTCKVWTEKSHKKNDC